MRVRFFFFPILMWFHAIIVFVILKYDFLSPLNSALKDPKICPNFFHNTLFGTTLKQPQHPLPPIQLNFRPQKALKSPTTLIHPQILRYLCPQTPNFTPQTLLETPPIYTHTPPFFSPFNLGQNWWETNVEINPKPLTHLELDPGNFQFLEDFFWRLGIFLHGQIVEFP